VCRHLSHQAEYHAWRIDSLDCETNCSCTKPPSSNCYLPTCMSPLAISFLGRGNRASEYHQAVEFHGALPKCAAPAQFLICEQRRDATAPVECHEIIRLTVPDSHREVFRHYTHQSEQGNCAGAAHFGAHREIPQLDDIQTPDSPGQEMKWPRGDMHVGR